VRRFGEVEDVAKAVAFLSVTTPAIFTRQCPLRGRAAWHVKKSKKNVLSAGAFLSNIARRIRQAGRLYVPVCRRPGVKKEMNS